MKGTGGSRHSEETAGRQGRSLPLPLLGESAFGGSRWCDCKEITRLSVTMEDFWHCESPELQVGWLIKCHQPQFLEMAYPPSSPLAPPFNLVSYKLDH